MFWSYSFSGDICDNDSDNDGISDEIDNCIFVSNPNQEHKLLGYDLSCKYNFDVYICLIGSVV